MTPEPPDEAVQIALRFVRDVDEAHAVVAALARAGWLHDPRRVAALEALAKVVYGYWDGCEATYNDLGGALAALDAAPTAAPAAGGGCTCRGVDEAPGCRHDAAPAAETTTEGGKRVDTSAYYATHPGWVRHNAQRVAEAENEDA